LKSTRFAIDTQFTTVAGLVAMSCVIYIQREVKYICNSI